MSLNGLKNYYIFFKKILPFFLIFCYTIKYIIITKKEFFTMKHFLKKSVIFLLFIFLVLLSHTISYASYKEYDSFYTGNNSENILNGGYIAYDNGSTYCSDLNSSHYLYLLKDEETTLLSKDSCSYINVTDDYIYYVKNRTQLCRLNKKNLEKETIYQSKSTISDFYVVNETDYYFITDGDIHYYSTQDTVFYEDGQISHIIPTENGILYAKGELFNWTVYANNTVISENVTSFYEMNGYLYFTKDSKDMQASCDEVFASSSPSQAVEEYVNTEVPTDLSDTDTIAENTSNTLLTAEEESDEVIALSSDVTSALSSVSKGQQNIVKRAMQQYEIKWTPKKNIYSWGKRSVFKAGVTYQGLPYGQAVYASYVPWDTSLSGFLTAVNSSSSKMYTKTSTYNKTAPYYSTDCSAFVSWSWGTSSRKTTRTLYAVANKVSTQSIYSMQIGDALVYAGSHTVLVTDIGYDSDGNLAYIDITEQTPPKVKKTRYGVGGSYSLSTLTSKYLKSHYVLYRYKNRENVSYTHSCAVPLSGDTCTKCLSKYTVTGLSKTKATISTLTLKWNSLSNVTEYQIYRSTSSTSGFKKIATVTTTTFTDIGLTAGETYYYKVRGSDDTRTTKFSEVKSFLFQAVSPTIKSLSESLEGITVKWTAVSGASRYRVYRKSVDGNYETLIEVDSNITSYLDTEVAKDMNGVYIYTVKAFEDIDDTSYSSKFTPTAWLETPTISKSKLTDSGAYLKWNTIEDAEKYFIYRKASGENWEKIGETTKTSYTDKKGLLGISYTYSVSAVYNSNTSNKSNETDEILMDWTEIPSMQSASIESTGSKITWSKINKCSGYYLYRKEVGKNWEQVATVVGTSYTDTSASNTKLYYYSAKAYSKEGNTTSTSDMNSSGISRAAKLSVTVSNVSSGISIKWSKITPVSNYKLYRRTSNSTTWKLLTTTTSTKYTDKTIKNNTKYVYAVTAYYNGNQVTSLTSSSTITTSLSTPVIKVSLKGKKVTITWNKVSGAKNYRVYYKKKNSTWQTIHTTTKCSYSYTLKSKGQYYFTVKAFNGSNSSNFKASKLFTIS
jgi:fibronectin type 3 domain-containing protein